MTERGLAKLAIRLSGLLGAFWGILLAFRALFFDDMLGPLWQSLGVASASVVVGYVIGMWAGRWVVKRLIELRGKRPIMLFVSPFLGAISGAIALVVIFEISSVMAFYAGVIDYGESGILLILQDSLMIAGAIGAAIGAGTALLICVAFCAFPPPKRIRLDR